MRTVLDVWRLQSYSIHLKWFCVVQWALDNGACTEPPPPSMYDTVFIGWKRPKEITAFSLSTLMSFLTHQCLLLLFPPSLPVSPPRGASSALPPRSRAAHLLNLILRFVRLIPCTHTAQCGVIIGTPLIYVSSYRTLNGWWVELPVIIGFVQASCRSAAHRTPSCPALFVVAETQLKLC